MPLSKTQALHNGIVLNTQMIATAKTVAIGFWFNVGSRDETECERGISHFVEHLLFKGTKSHSSKEISKAFDEIGSYANAFTDRENVCLHCTVSAKNHLKALDLLCDISMNSILPISQIQKESSVIKSEIASYIDDAEDCALDALHHTIWNVEGLQNDITGTAKDIDNITKEQLDAWYDLHFRHGSLWVCIAGNFDIVSCTKALETLPTRSLPLLKIAPLPSVAWNSGLHILHSKFLQSQMFFCARMKYPLDKKLYNIATVFNAIAGDTMSSRLFQTLREVDGFCYNIYSYFNFYKDAAFWCVYAACDKKDTLPLVEKTMQVIQSLTSCNISQSELEIAKEHILGERTIGSEDMEYVIKEIDRDYFFNFACETDTDFEQSIHDITIKDINDFACFLLKGSRDTAQNALVLYTKPLPFMAKKRLRAIYESFHI